MTHDESNRSWTGLGAYPWLVLVIASAGWVFDVYEGQLFVVFKTPALAELLGVQAGSPAIDRHANWANACFLLGGAVGGLGFGILGDRIGRVRTLALTIGLYSIFSALTAFAQSAWQVDLLRFLVALGTGGEWAVAASLVAETFPARGRAFASGTFHASSVLGAGLAALTQFAFTGPGAWRRGFLIGLAPALLILVVRLWLREPAGWVEARQAAARGRPVGSLRELLGDPRWSRRAWIGLGLSAVGLGTYWSIFAWSPELVDHVLRGSSPERVARARSLAYLLMNFTGGFVGLLAFAPLATWLGRRPAFAIYHVAALVLVPVTFLGARTYEQVLWLLPVMAFFVVGMHAGYAIYFPELFPTRLRATGSSFCFNVGRLVTALLLLVRGELGARLGLTLGVATMAGLFVFGLALLAVAPETRGLPLPD